MRGAYKVFDACRHVVEPRALWAAQHVNVDEGSGTITIKGKPVVRARPNLMAEGVYRSTYASAIDAGFSAASNLADMDREGIDAALLLPTLGLFVPYGDHVDAALAREVCRTYNDWLAEYCNADRSRLKGAALVPLQDPADGAKELARAVQELGMAAAVMRPNPVAGRKLHDPAYDVLYQTANDLGVPLVLRALSGTSLPELGADRFQSVFGIEAVVDPFEMMLAFMSFNGHDVLERFPDLRVGYLGAGVGWLPYWLDRVDEHWGGFFGKDSPSLLAPSHLFRTQGFAAADPWERSLPEVIVETRLHTLLWGSQYPRPELVPLFPHELDGITNDPLLTEEQKEAILWDNAAALFDA